MIMDALMDFGLPAITNSNAATISPNVYDAGSAKKEFGGAPAKAPKLFYRQAYSAAAESVKVDFVGADDAALTTNVEVIASTGVMGTDKAGTAFASAEGQIAQGYLDLHSQRVPKRYYGARVTLGGTNPDATAGKAFVTLDAQTNQLDV